ncbi:MAG: purine-binding chemotaxis protein CheW [Nitrospirae bacterium]|nr:purine-binding chemotaxis protein CheW [Nitrospirota bacterium]
MNTATIRKPAKQAGVTGNEWEHKYLTLSIEREEYAVSVAKVREIIGVGPITRLPNMAAHIKGVLNLRGSVVPVVDLRLKYGLAGRDYTDRTCIVVLELEGRAGPNLMGVVVDSVNEVVRIPPDRLAPPPAGAERLMNGCVPGVANWGDKVYIVVDIEKALADDAFYADAGF